MRTITQRNVSLAALALLASSAFAHHSSAMFDDKKSVTLAGSVKAFQFTNPHCWIQLLVESAQGPVEWSVEMGSPSQLFKGGWKPGTLKSGEKIVVVIHPTRDGSSAGLYVSATTEDGKPIGAAAQSVGASP